MNTAQLALPLADLCVPTTATLMEAMRVLDRGEAIAFVCEEQSGRVVGTLTDGDLRRGLLRGLRLEDRCLPAVMKHEFRAVTASVGRAEVLDMLKSLDIRHLPVLDAEGRLCGLHTLGQLFSPRQRPNGVVIMAGGKGTRLRPLTETIPKPMLMVAGRPILERLILHCMSFGLRRFHLAVNYLADVIEGHFGDGSRLGCRIEYLRESKPLGTGGSLSLLRPIPEDPVLVINGDLVTQCDLDLLLDFHAQGGHGVTFGLRPYTLTIPFGVATVRDDELIEVREKPTETMLINAGVYVVSPEVLRLVPAEVEYPMTALHALCMEAGLTVGAHVLSEEWSDVGQYEELNRARGYL